MADDLISQEKLKKHYAWWENGSEMDKLYKAIFDSIINLQPTVDAVEVVRCEHCVHHKNAPKTTDVWCERIDGLLPKNWFCADGERETEDAPRVSDASPTEHMVRCKDCRFWKTETEPIGIECKPGETAHYCHMSGMITRTDDFCNYGGRRDDEPIH